MGPGTACAQYRGLGRRLPHEWVRTLSPGLALTSDNGVTGVSLSHTRPNVTPQLPLIDCTDFSLPVFMGSIFLSFFLCPWVCDGVYVARWPERREQRAPRAVSSPGSAGPAQTGVTTSGEKTPEWTLVSRVPGHTY